MTALYAIPPFVLLILAIALAVAIACAGEIFVHRRFRESNFVPETDVAGFIVAVVGTLYAVVLGFVTIVVWQHYEDARAHVASETASVGDMWHNAVSLPQPVRSDIRGDMLAYARIMVDDEWPMMRNGNFSPEGDRLIMDATTAVGQMVPHNLGQANGQAATMHLLNELHDARLERLASNHAAVSAFQWVVLFIGAFVVLTFCFLFSVERLGAHLMMTSAVAVLIASLFVLIFELQYPFRSSLGVTSETWSGLIQHIGDMDRMNGPMTMRM